jgi:hypothetical protein
MVAGMRCYLAAGGLDVAYEVEKASLILSSDQRHLANGRFDVDRMMCTLEGALEQALNDGYTGLWATGDMTWELGPEKDFSKLLEYEWRWKSFSRDILALLAAFASTMRIRCPVKYCGKVLSHIRPFS